jgi:hypothetical protein
VDNIKIPSREIFSKVWIFIHVAIDTVKWRLSCENGNELSGVIKAGNHIIGLLLTAYLLPVF